MGALDPEHMDKLMFLRSHYKKNDAFHGEVTRSISIRTMMWMIA